MRYYQKFREQSRKTLFKVQGLECGNQELKRTKVKFDSKVQGLVLTI